MDDNGYVLVLLPAHGIIILAALQSAQCAASSKAQELGRQFPPLPSHPETLKTAGTVLNQDQIVRGTECMTSWYPRQDGW